MEFKLTTIGKTIRTFLQGCMWALPLTIGIFMLPEVQIYIKDNITWLTPLVPVITAICTFIYNKYENRNGKA